MEECVKQRCGERRWHRRISRGEDHRIVAATVRPGHRGRVIDVSAGGVLLETTHRLLPGSSVELHVQSPNRCATVRGRVLRCTVVRVRPTFICYRGAIGFDRHLTWFVDEESSGPSNGDARPAHPFRADATPEVM
jgi:hypothetical protein